MPLLCRICKNQIGIRCADINRLKIKIWIKIKNQEQNQKKLLYHTMPHIFTGSNLKSTRSVLLELSRNQFLINQFANQTQNCRISELQSMGQELLFKQAHKQLCLKIFKFYQKMQLSIETLFLALELSSSLPFISLIKKEIDILKFPNKNHELQTVNRLLLGLNDQNYSKQEIHQVIVQTYALSLLYVCHKIMDDLKNKYSASVWIENLRLQNITVADIKQAEKNIALAFHFDILKQTVFSLLCAAVQQMKIKKSQFSFFTQYLLELYLNSNLKRFIGVNNLEQRVVLVFSAIKLGCHFLCPKSWNSSILSSFNFGINQVQKQSKKLFAILLDKQNNMLVHQKYETCRYRGVSKIKIVQQKKPLIQKNQLGSQSQTCGHTQKISKSITFQKKANEVLNSKSSKIFNDQMQGNLVQSN